MEVAAIRSVSNTRGQCPSWYCRPVRAPHHSATSPALIGGGNKAQPGEISLAHRGLLFLDELTEFKPHVLDTLREPLEAGEITLSRANYRLRFPASFQLVAAMNPCPCGYAGDTRNECRCSQDRIDRYLGRISGPLLDRLDLIIEVPVLSHAELFAVKENPEPASSAELRQRVAECRAAQQKRAGVLNNELRGAELEALCRLEVKLQRWLADTMERLSLSARAAHRIMRVARTIADLEGAARIRKPHLMEAVGYRHCRMLRALLR